MLGKSNLTEITSMLFSRKAVSKRHLLLIAAGFSTVLTGCATSPASKVASSTKVEYYPNCYEPVQHLRGADAGLDRVCAHVGIRLMSVSGSPASQPCQRVWRRAPARRRYR